MNEPDRPLQAKIGMNCADEPKEINAAFNNKCKGSVFGIVVWLAAG
jgi:hypothetical protein